MDHHHSSLFISRRKLLIYSLFQKLLESLLDQTCSILPVDQSTCQDTVNGMFEALISLFESYKPDEVSFQI